MRHHALAVAVALSVSAVALRAQSAAPGPSLAGTRLLDVRRAPSARRALPAIRDPRTLDRGQKLMIVGGAVLLTGLLVGGDAGAFIALGGAGIGIYGLVIYLKV